MDIIREMRLRAKKRQKLIVLPEKADPRIKEAAKIIQKEGIARIAVLGKEDLEQKKIEQFAQVFFELRKHKGMTVDEARRVVGQPLYYAAMMVRLGEADGFVAGAANSTPDVARSAIYCLGVDPKINIVSSCFVMVVPDCSFGENGVFIFADCGIVPSPDARQLAGIAISSAKLAEDLFAMTPRVAMLSYSTKGSAKGEFVDKVVEAAKLAKFARPDLLIDGELQLDAAIIPEVAQIKDPGGILGGRANVLIFPDLEAGNIGYKLVQRLAKARAVGPLLQGLNHPCSDLSRGCFAEDIVDTVAFTALRA